ncbi:hypothetical protein QJS10_CPB15g01736 [Acorus calamus]|uniref:Uncharacterized protein n=1 Tax=Acorus calamus TaxID=4465 RepID=A0AAV9D7Q7_ACOCL|nr:hypothetical protein QJS10_CPB15g01736 [Acorus calamus]
MNDGASRVTLEKRRKAMVKKMRESIMLRDIPRSMVIYAPEKEEPVEVWPDKVEVEALPLISSTSLNLSIPKGSRSRGTSGAALRERIGQSRSKSLPLDSSRGG